MSDTPRTDKVLKAVNECVKTNAIDESMAEAQAWDWARQLERENAELRRHVENLQKSLKIQTDLVEKADEEFEQMREIMAAAATMAGKHWFACQVALSEYLTSGKGDNLDWMIEEYRQFKAEQKAAESSEKTEK